MLEGLLITLRGWIASGRATLDAVLAPVQLWQVIVLAGVALMAWSAGRALSERMTGWIRAREGWGRGRLRSLVVLRDRLGLACFALLCWLAVALARVLGAAPAERVLLEGAASIGTALLAVGLAARLIANHSLRAIVRWGAWIWAVLWLTGLLDEAVAVLDRAAVDAGGTRISVYGLLKLVVVTAALMALASFLARVLSDRVRARADISPSLQVLTVKGLQVGLFATALFVGLRAVGVDLTGLAVLSGAIGVGIGFGLQKVVSNLVSGVIILLDKSIKPGDVITIGETFGWITELGARYVSISTRDGKDYLIPNEDLITGQVVNWSHTDALVRLDITFGCSYGDDPHRVRAVAVEACVAVARVSTTTRPVCHVTGFGDSSVDYILRFWIEDPTQGLTNVRGAVFLALWDAFRAEGITIPFPQREVRLLGRGDGATPS
ncbi:mechanosensitive ion channel family protein [Frigidibacter sp. MR17.24]|uniref:mechanosensitive ion channel family protein n=1 Tax=Frigidibacter sp. MR17.24 TaxID=3127345 RepID=UPI003012E255